MKPNFHEQYIITRYNSSLPTVLILNLGDMNNAQIFPRYVHDLHAESMDTVIRSETAMNKHGRRKEDSSGFSPLLCIAELAQPRLASANLNEWMDGWMTGR